MKAKDSSPENPDASSELEQRRIIEPLDPKRVPSVAPGLEGVAAFAADDHGDTYDYHENDDASTDSHEDDAGSDDTADSGDTTGDHVDDVEITDSGDDAGDAGEIDYAEVDPMIFMNMVFKGDEGEVVEGDGSGDTGESEGDGSDTPDDHSADEGGEPPYEFEELFVITDTEVGVDHEGDPTETDGGEVDHTDETEGDQTEGTDEHEYTGEEIYQDILTFGGVETTGGTGGESSEVEDGSTDDASHEEDGSTDDVAHEDDGTITDDGSHEDDMSHEDDGSYADDGSHEEDGSHEGEDSHEDGSLDGELTGTNVEGIPVDHFGGVNPDEVLYFSTGGILEKGDDADHDAGHATDMNGDGVVDIMPNFRDLSANHAEDPVAMGVLDSPDASHTEDVASEATALHTIEHGHEEDAHDVAQDTSHDGAHAGHHQADDVQAVDFSADANGLHHDALAHANDTLDVIHPDAIAHHADSSTTVEAANGSFLIQPLSLFETPGQEVHDSSADHDSHDTAEVPEYVPLATLEHSEAPAEVNHDAPVDHHEDHAHDDTADIDHGADASHATLAGAALAIGAMAQQKPAKRRDK